MDVLLRVTPFFLIVAVGAVAARAKIIDLVGARALSAYVLWIGFPALLIHSLAHSLTDSAAGLGVSLAVYAIAMVIPMAMVFGLGRLLRWKGEESAGASAGAIMGNTAFLGAPLAISLFGPGAAGPAAGVIATDCIVIVFLITLSLRNAATPGALGKTLLLTISNPLVIASVLGLALALTHTLPPDPVDQALAVLRASASPVGLIALGVVIGLEFGEWEKSEAAPVATAVLSKLLLAPVLVWFATGLVHADPMFRITSTLMAACPTAVTIFIQTRTYGVFSRGGAMVVVAATVIAVLTLPLIGGFLSAHAR